MDINNECASEKSIENLEEMFYKSCLKQVVTFLNSNLPNLSEEESESEVKTKKVKYRVTKKTTGIYGIKDSKKIKKAILKEMDAVSKILDTKKPKMKEMKNSDEPTNKKRMNKYSEKKYNDFKKEKQLKKRSKNITTNTSNEKTKKKQFK